MLRTYLPPRSTWNLRTPNTASIWPGIASTCSRTPSPPHAPSWYNYPISIMYRLCDYIDLGALTTPGDGSLMQLTTPLGEIYGFENTQFSLVKQCNHKSSFWRYYAHRSREWMATRERMTGTTRMPRPGARRVREAGEEAEQWHTLCWFLCVLDGTAKSKLIPNIGTPGFWTGVYYCLWNDVCPSFDIVIHHRLQHIL